MERTLSIVKPDAVAKNQVGAILAMLEGVGLHIAAARFLRLAYRINMDQLKLAEVAVREGEAPAEPLSKAGSAGASPSRTATGICKPL